ncbi:tyrosine-type recombinase/integrase [Hymenobacter cheonanensis]|uniref:tyrosine-type recombinase/integrase n=1 Tax=Hymenobacter sp. CA2-7 TaxID=3063993 RepID=UPI00271343EC|nr:tyrosine-type recombinase/integrase [Hymenobacter sp. CA2-7]MDO7887977.1 tyrosine-type recombinase/integrase [Hymenobacter sp. CA2-7]
MPATFKLVLAAKADSDGLFDVRLRLTADRVVRYQNTGIALPEKQWNPNATLLTKNWVRTAHRKHAAYNADLLRWHDRAQQLAQDNPGWGADQLKAALRNGDLDPEAPDFIKFCHERLDAEQQLVDEAYAKRRPTVGLSQGSIDVRRPSINKFAAWHGKPLPFPLLTVELLKKYELYLLHTVGNAATTVVKELKTLRLFITKAIRAKLLKPQDDPMHFYEYPSGKAKRVWLEQEEVVNFETVPLPRAAHLARTVYFIQHYAHGSRIGVILRLKWQDRAGGRLRFTMDKGGQEKDVEETPELTALLDSLLPPGGSPRPGAYILPYLPANFEQLHPHQQIQVMKNKLTTINGYLRRAAKKLGIEKRLSSHVARRTLATLGERALGGDLRATGGMLGHRRTSTTEIYLRGMDTAQVDTASHTVYEALRVGKTQVKQTADAHGASASDEAEKAA